MIHIVFNWLVAFAFGSVVMSILALTLLRFLAASSASVRFLVAQSATVGSLLLALLLAMMPGYVLFPSAPQTRTIVASTDPAREHGPTIQAKSTVRAFDKEEEKNAARFQNAFAMGELENLPSKISVPIVPLIQGSSRAISTRDDVSLLQRLLIATWFLGLAVLPSGLLAFRFLPIESANGLPPSCHRLSLQL